MVCVLTLMSVLVSCAMMVSEPGSPLLGVGLAIIFLFWLLTLTHGPSTIFFQMKHAFLKY
jgi:hypothetical protein